MFYHNGKLPNGGGYKRSTCIEEFTPNEDGTIPFINFTNEGVEPLQTLNPFVLQEAETINQCKGIACEGDYNGCYVTNTNRSAYIKVRNVDFGNAGATSFKARVKSENSASLNIRTGSQSGAVKGRVSVELTNGEWVEVTCELATPITGIQDLFFTIPSQPSANFQIDNWQFFKEGTAIQQPHVQQRADHRVYDLKGQQLSGSQHGRAVRIVDGKKVVR
jgi:hypothetical protein